MGARKLPHGAALECDVCIIGAGPAGLAAASALIGKNLRVMILDAGGTTEARDDLGQTASTAHMADVDYITQTQRVGGNAHTWNVRAPGESRRVRFGRYHGSDIAARPAFGLTEPWPITDEELEHYHTRAAAFWKIPAPPEESPETGAVNLGPDISTTYYQFADARTLLDDVQAQIESATNIELLTYAQAQSLDFDADGETVTHVYVCSEPGRTFTVKARQYIVAANCINSTRLLLNSVTPKGHAPGNANDLLGRFSMEHPLVDGGILTVRDPSVFDRLRAFDIHERDGGLAMAHFRIARKTHQWDNLPDMSCILLPIRRKDAGRKPGARGMRAHAAALALREAIARREGFKFSDVMTAALGFDEVVRKGLRKLFDPKPNLGSGGWSKRPNPGRRFDAFQVLHIAEQPPRADNRLILSNETDGNGMRRCDISWQWHDEDQRALMRSQEVFAHAVEASGLGAMQIAQNNGRPVVVTSGVGHHLGTTRMHRDPSRGVVDKNCRVHGTSNLYVASGSVFPSGGYMNPTFTITALAILVADVVLATFSA